MSWWLLPLFTGLLLAALAGPLGSFVVWRRMAFLGDTLAHGALLGVTLGVLTSLSLITALMISCVIIALLLVWLQKGRALSSDTVLGIISHSALALGLVSLSLADNIRVDLMSYLLGDLLAIGEQQLKQVAIWVVLLTAVLVWHWRGLLAISVSEELAQVEGYSVLRLKLVLMLVLALFIALAMQLVGILLVSALLIIPAAAARQLAAGPSRMAVMASVIAMLSVALGMLASFYWDTPTGPSVVLAALLQFLLLLTTAKLRSTAVQV